MEDIWQSVDKIISEKRILLKQKIDVDKPTIIICAGLHGNEPLGVIALKRVISKLINQEIKINGNILAFVGNPSALKKKKRFIDIDLNRIWFDKERKDLHEFSQLDEIKNLIENFDKDIKVDNKFFIDLHTTSSKSIPFIVVSKNKASIDYSKKFPFPVVVNLDQFIDGTLISFLELKGYKGLAFEGGFHEDKSVLQHHEYFIWKALIDSKIIEADLSYINSSLTISRREILFAKDDLFEIKYRHNVTSQSSFKMMPGYENFQQISKSQALAVENGNEIISPFDGRIFLPLYQQNGSDGFFIIQSINY